MFRHVALFRWVPGTTDAQVDAVRTALHQLPAAIPELRNYRVGPDAGLADGNWHFAVVADFDTVDSWRAYMVNPEHDRVRTEVLLPLVAERAGVQYEY